ncbi:GntR family transcriptional regulator [Micromonospora sp. NBC_01739]|uniref:GntR family transcriptional regulator n=1 Tax=Micromonospora sp. NBC_01739 TaxID=2975985 RepID=UPI002E122ABA|nr:GntR family transcriptional regulator [Micromonospora sp. NBC_01739]
MATAQELTPAAIRALTREVSPAEAEALHEQISQLMRQRIESGEWPEHLKLPAEPELAGALNVSRGTVRRAIRTLIEAGLLKQTRGKGTFVRGQMLEQEFAQELISTAQSLDREGVEYQTQVLSARVIQAPSHIAAHLGLPADDLSVLAIRRTRSVAGEVVYLLDNYLPTVLCPDLSPQVLQDRSLFGVLEHDYGVTVDSVRRTFSAILPGDEVSDAMSLRPGVPVLYLEQISYQSNGDAVEYSDVWVRGDRVRISSWIKR